jgi:hypothetical protein
LAESRKHNDTAFRTKRQLWSYSGLGLETRNSGGYSIVHGQLKRSKKVVAIRGLNKNHNHDLKNIFKGAAIRAAAKGMNPPMARLTLARKIAAITLGVAGTFFGDIAISPAIFALFPHVYGSGLQDGHGRVSREILPKSLHVLARTLKNYDSMRILRYGGEGGI